MSASGQSGSSGILQPPWSSMTLAGLIAGAARLRAESPLIADGVNVEPLAHRPRRDLGCGDVKSEADRLAGQLRVLGIEPGEVVLLHLPNTVEASIALLGVLTAGAVPAPTPVFEDVESVRACAELCGAAAIVTMASFAGLPLAEKCRSAAVDALSVRFVAAFGADLPEGVVPLDSFVEADGIEAPAMAMDGSAPGLITFDTVSGARRALLRSHEQVIAETAAAAGLIRLGAGDRLLVTVPPSSIAGLVFGLALPLLAGASAELIPLFDSCAFATQLGRGEATLVVLPGRSEAAFRQFCEENAVRCEGLVLIHRPDPDAPALPVPEAGHVRCLDAVCLGEAVLAVRARAESGDAGRLAAARTHPVQGVIAGDAPLLKLSLDQAGQLNAGGPASPTPLLITSAGACPTGFSARTCETGELELLARRERLFDAA